MAIFWPPDVYLLIELGIVALFILRWWVFKSILFP